MKPLPATNPWTATNLRSRLRVGLDGGSVDQLDAALRGLAVGIVLALSLVGYKYSPPAGWVLPFPVAPAMVALGLVLYNVAVVTLLGIPWRQRPGFVLFVLDWMVVTTAIVFTGGFNSPFLVLYYALVIGAALRLNLQRTLVLVLACAGVYTLLSETDLRASDGTGGHLPGLVVGVTSLLMVALTALAMRRAVGVENDRLRLEQQTAQRLALLNELTRAVLSASPDSAALLRTVAAIAPDALGADCGVAVLLDRQGRPQQVAADQGSAPDLPPGALALALAAVAQGGPVVIEDVTGDGRGADLRVCLGRVATVVCAPLLLDEEPVGAVIVGSYEARQFRPADLSLLTAIGRQVGLSVRLARLYDLERDKATESAAREQGERDLLNTVSHDLRTPLTAIKTGVSGLLAGDAPRPPAELRLLQNIDRSTERLILLVNDLLDMARLRAGRVTLAEEQLDLAEVIHEAVTTLRPLVEARGQTLTLALPAGVLSVAGDRRRLEQALLNILYNANKYTPSGGTITVGATAEAASVRVWVRDSGPGIAPSDQRRIFERFYVAPIDGGRSDATGLGLAIAQSLVELHGGQIGVESRPGAGSLFYFTVPVQSAVCDVRNMEYADA
ncbi:MAG: GAF domain-containing sensor histidine kinase [Chloroflexota bacterium]|nr:GAF domain-containing sensor histidine kinase [Chloroflexota bacterium]